ncbi:response regulator transcription factor [Actinomadura kijaniata]|uniref:DNA-binding NarL/FixJ family response regulator n=1 Tax=Actinomadura namibiensis TaxID=182080 RepID=A0A7W3LXD1_ACTNM|nr:LuxR C-terminal-related transcriptional regulator [Actinomadura namibiensis]MBA8956001.1 DNA-binding NarL/FixJ family response regulator [Actinomadura namibiensis]
MATPVTVAVVDDHDVVLSGVRAWLEQAPHPIEVVAAATDLDGLDPTADVLITDLRVGGELVLDRIADLAAAGRRVVVFSRHAEAPLVRRAERAGALAYVCKESPEGREHLVGAVLAAAHGKPYTAPSRAGATAAHRPRFSEQELRTMRLWLGGLTRAAVARQMGISEHTVKQYLERARRKYAQAGREAPTRIDLYREAQRDGIVGL